MDNAAYPLVAQLTFRGMPFNQAMKIAKALLLRVHQRADFLVLLKAMRDIPVFPLENETDCPPEEGSSIGEVVSRIILKFLERNQPTRTIAQSIRLASQAMKFGACPHSIVEAFEKALDKSINSHELNMFIWHRLGIDIPYEAPAPDCPDPVFDRRAPITLPNSKN